MLVRRFGRPGLLGTMARTAVIAGTATATANALNRRSMRGEQQAAEAEAYERASGSTDQAGPGDPGAAEPLGDQLAKVAQLHAAGALTDQEFAAAKSRLLG